MVQKLSFGAAFVPFIVWRSIGFREAMSAVLFVFFVKIIIMHQASVAKLFQIFVANIVA